MRLDKYLLLKSFYNTRSSAQNNIKLGNVSVNNKIVNNCHLEVNDNDVITINKTNQYVSRGAYKLLGAIDEFKIDFNRDLHPGYTPYTDNSNKYQISLRLE